MAPEPVNVGLLVARGPQADTEALEAFAARACADARPELEDASGRPWRFHHLDATRLSSDDAQRPSDFLDEAALRMVEGPFDAVVVVTDAPLVSPRHTVVPGLASPVARVAVVSTRKLRQAPRGEPTRPLGSDVVRWNAATLILHLLGHAFGARHEDAGAMRPFAVDPQRRALEPFGPDARAALRRSAAAVPDRTLAHDGALHTLRFYASSAARHWRQAVAPLRRNRAPLLALNLPGLATAAAVPTLVLVFTAEIWDVGLNLGNGTAAGFATAAVLGATWYVTAVQNLFFPRKEKRVLTEHMAVVNASILLTMLLAMVGLLLMLTGLMLAVESFVFPPGLIQTWPTLGQPAVTGVDKLRIAAFISTVGVLTGALAGGLESRSVIRHIALFQEAP